MKCPKQSEVLECGYYVMWFMRDIILSRSTSIIQIMKDSPRAYTQDDINSTMENTVLEENKAAMININETLKVVLSLLLQIPALHNLFSFKSVVDKKVMLKCVVNHEVLLKGCVVDYEVLLKCVVDHEVLFKCCVVDHEVLLKCVVDTKMLLKYVVDHEVLLKCCVVDHEVLLKFRNEFS
ncbi:metallothionein-1-like [Cucumis melo var. makuwa]|uniref:Metallothionein-1-like n=1 Tax=Cucumis melo var. makuwa TaxID=1194695 RepID=A0A5A7U7G6_CUCMM|nr:metallothionein-1-like [Cucumis melo var. makuwa]